MPMLKEAIDHEINARTSTNDAIFCPKACAYLPGLIPDLTGVVIMEVVGVPGVTHCLCIHSMSHLQKWFCSSKGSGHSASDHFGRKILTLYQQVPYTL